MSARFPRRNSMPTRTIVGAYIFSITLLFLFLIASNPWQRLIMLMSTLGWFLVAITFFFINLLRAARDTENLQDAQRARIVFFSIAVAELPLLMRPFSIALNLDALPYNVVLFFQLFVPLGISYAVLRHDLFGIDRVLRRTLAYGTVSILLVTLYLALTTGMTALLRICLRRGPSRLWSVCSSPPSSSNQLANSSKPGWIESSTPIDCDSKTPCRRCKIRWHAPTAASRLSTC
ncbi:hypothetical protein [Candidatus Villigracilis affinis]|uniref:hypothetical protein n=1 Tax=Candidatus Villigracilis affinis TaxID=3140682 RepID=UPI002A194275|nr:hypothetical protein [Anaerolineales bacterium]